MTGLSDLNFNEPEPVQTQIPQEVEKTRTQELSAHFAAEAQKKDEWSKSQDRLQPGIDRWVGVPSGPQNPMHQGPAYLKPQKNHVKVLLGTLHTILW